MDTFGDVDFRALAVMVWLIIAARTLLVILVPTLLVFAARRGKLRSPVWSLLAFRGGGGTFP